MEKLRRIHFCRSKTKIYKLFNEYEIMLAQQGTGKQDINYTFKFI